VPPPGRLTARRPALGAEELAARFHPPRRFGQVRFDTFVPNPAHPSQAGARAAMETFVEEVVASALVPRRRWGRPRPETDRTAPGRYLDGGFGVGKTHLLAAAWHAAPPPKAYLTFAELTAVIGFLGMEGAVGAFSGYRLLCIDEFELDDVANTLMTVTFLRSVVPAGVRVAVTSNSLPDRLGEGRFSAEDFTREIAAIASWFEVVRIDGPDYRASAPESTVALPTAAADALVAGATGPATDDGFAAVLDHLRRVHPVQYGPLVEGLDTVVVREVAPVGAQDAALAFVALVDELYDAELTFGMTGCDVGAVFDGSYRHGGFRKKYGRCESRLAAMLGEACTRLAPP
jgi:cell division protein ZapE